jgi:5'-methylthioadenosine phosphorylase
MFWETPEKVSIGLMGGTGVYDPKFLTDVKEYKVYTPYGATSDKVMIGTMKTRRVAFIPRHRRDHTIPPHLVNYRANIWALKSVGVKRLISISAVGGLQEDYGPGTLVVLDQCFDWTRTRKKTFFEGGPVVHVSLADPFCPTLRQFIIDRAKAIKMPIKETGTVVTIEGPQFSTRAESRFYRNQGFHIISMTVSPEVNLAREAELCYATIGMVTDYDVWADHPVSAEEVGKTMAGNIEKVRRLIMEVIPALPEAQDKCTCGHALKGALQ